MRALKSVNNVFPCLFLSGWSVFRVSPLVLHGSSGKQVVFPFQTDQHHQCPNPHSGKLYDSFLCVSGVGILQHKCQNWQRGVITGTWAVAREVYAFYSGVAEVLHTCTNDLHFAVIVPARIESLTLHRGHNSNTFFIKSCCNNISSDLN